MPAPRNKINVRGGQNANIRKRVEQAAEIFEKHGDVIRAMIRFQVSDESKVDDIFQDLFLSVVEKPIPADMQNIKGYLYRAITNDVIDVARRTRSYRDRVSRYAESRERSTSQEEPQNTVVQAEEIQKLFQLIEGQLPPCEAEAVIQRYRYDHDTACAAEQMRVDARTVSRYICVALKKIRQFIRENQGDVK